MLILTLVCSNGLGHYRRCIEILSRIQQTKPEAEFLVCCEAWQIERMQDWALSREFWSGRAKAIHGVMQPGVSWSNDPSIYGDGRLFSWENRLEKLPELETADLVISDNLPGILRFRPDATLMGSFLWGGLLAAKHPLSAEAQRYAAYESELLLEHKPPMVCVDSLAMPSISELCKPVKTGFMCPEPYTPAVNENFQRDRIAVLVGATPALVSELPNLFESLLEKADGPIWTSQNLIQRQEKRIAKHLRAFGFSAEDYASCAVVICRPGVGTITECLAQATPMITIYEPGNKEMEHNSLILEQLGVGINAGPELSCNRMQNALVECLERSAEMQLRATTLDRNGFSHAVSYFLDRVAKD